MYIIRHVTFQILAVIYNHFCQNFLGIFPQFSIHFFGIGRFVFHLHYRDFWEIDPGGCGRVHLNYHFDAKNPEISKHVVKNIFVLVHFAVSRNVVRKP